MDGELEYGGRGLIEDQPSETEQSKTYKSYSEVFDAAFPEYLAMGMTYDLYWHGDASLVKAFRKAKKIRREEKNFELWLQGKYIYEAIGALAPILRTSLSKTPAKAEKYVSKPYPLDGDAAKKAIENAQKARMMGALERFKREAETKRLKRLQQEKEAREKNGE